MAIAGTQEIAVSRWWNSADLSSPLTTVDGNTIQIVYRGSWSHGLGPDFQNALLDFGNGHLVRGSIEIHLATSAWRQHGHHHDPRYNDVILHLVLEHDGAETRRADGKLIPVAVIAPAPELLTTLQHTHFDWNLVGGSVCAETVSRDDPDAVRAVLWQLGDKRLTEKVTQCSARLDRDYPADLLFELILDGLGYSTNREPMRDLAARLPVHTIDTLLATVSRDKQYDLGLGLLLGAGGFLPLAPSDADLLGLSPDSVEQLETFWKSHGGPWHHERLPPTIWNRTRVRPANHPLVRLGMAAALLVNSFEGLTAALIDVVRRGDDPVRFLIDRSAYGDHVGIGTSRAVAIVANAVIPFLLALAESSGDPELSEQASRRWETLEAGEANQITRRAMKQVAGAIRIGHLGERGMQGLIELDRHFCEPRHCMECPIAWLELTHRSAIDSAALE